MTSSQRDKLSLTHQLLTVWGIPIITGLLTALLWFVVKHVENQEKINERLLQQVQEHETRINVHDYIITHKGYK